MAGSLLRALDLDGSRFATEDVVRLDDYRDSRTFVIIISQFVDANDPATSAHQDFCILGDFCRQRNNEVNCRAYREVFVHPKG